MADMDSKVEAAKEIEFTLPAAEEAVKEKPKRAWLRPLLMFGIPALILFLGLGMLVGSDGLGWVEFDDYGLARNIGIIALALILFEGGLSAGFNELRPVAGPAIIRVTIAAMDAVSATSTATMIALAIAGG